MFLGLLIGLTLFGVLFGIANTDDPNRPNEVRRTMERYRHIAAFCSIVGICGAIGWIIEVIMQVTAR